MRRALTSRECGSALVSSRTRSKNMSGRKWKPLKSSRGKRGDRGFGSLKKSTRMNFREDVSPDMPRNGLRRNRRQLSRTNLQTKWSSVEGPTFEQESRSE